MPAPAELLDSAITLREEDTAESGSVLYGKETDLETGGSGGGTMRPTSGSDVSGNKERCYSKEDGSEVIVVDWKGKDDPLNPKNWSDRRRMGATLIPLSSSTIAPAAGQVAEKLHITNEVSRFPLLLAKSAADIFARPDDHLDGHFRLRSWYVQLLRFLHSSLLIPEDTTAFAVGPLIFGPMSELYGRVRVLQGANVLYLIFNLVCAFAKTKGQFIAFRFMAGLGGGAPLSIGAGVLSDLWRPEERGKSAALYSLGPLLGPAMGPVIGGWITEKLPNDGYRWIFFSTTIFSAFVQLFGLFYLRETYAPTLLGRQVRELKKSLDLPPNSDKVQTVFEARAGGKKSPKEVIRRGMIRPFVLMGTEPILQILAIFMALVYGIVFMTVYHESTGIAGTNFIAMALGFFLASQIGARALDVIYRKLKERYGGEGKPEYRLPLMFPACILLPFGLLLYGWSAQHHLPWISTDIGMFFVSVAMILIFQGIQLFLIDAFTLHAASAIAAMSSLRSICGFAFPLFSPYLYSGVGYGWGCTILAGVAVLIPVIYLYGEKIRMRSRMKKLK
ncbi:SPOSA6832_02101 [Sporobolomyces salmonicolor]|uniref:SPOSA6832_02101-mRNA-1:cds n=1 Tax=Sporidiobolus salmonicolor TaxID=5005 RepID=A0A0D6EKG9_SPOSA|nr:SPOSA6832_02101 [Sporobolomyces salmonicolor]